MKNKLKKRENNNNVAGLTAAALIPSVQKGDLKNSYREVMIKNFLAIYHLSYLVFPYLWLLGYAFMTDACSISTVFTVYL